MKTLIAAGHRLAIDPETFEVSLGPLKGRALNVSVAEKIEAPPRRVVSLHGEVVAVPGRTTYQSELTIVWNVDSAAAVAASFKEDLVDFQQRLRTHIEYANLEDQEFDYGAREV